MDRCDMNVNLKYNHSGTPLDMNKIFNYESPITVHTRAIKDSFIEQQEGAIFRAVLDIGVEVNKEELIKALKYDRQQYETGFMHGYKTASSYTTHEKAYQDGWDAALEHVMKMLKGE